MPIMCYEQFIKKLFRTKSSRNEHDMKKAVQSENLPRKRINVDAKTSLESDESLSYSYSFVEDICAEMCSCQNGLFGQQSICKNCFQSSDLRSFRRHQSECFSPQKITSPVIDINLPQHVHRPLQSESSRTYVHQKRRRMCNHIKSSLPTNSADKLEAQSICHSYPYQFNKAFHSPPPNKNPFFLDTDIR